MSGFYLPPDVVVLSVDEKVREGEISLFKFLPIHVILRYGERGYSRGPSDWSPVLAATMVGR
jgi:hypothetical protein